MMQVLGTAVEGTKGSTSRSSPTTSTPRFHHGRREGDKFGPEGDGAKHQTVAIQFQNIKGNECGAVPATRPSRW